VLAGQGYYELGDDLYAFDYETSSVTRITTAGVGPSARTNHVAVLDTVRDRLLVFGGRGHHDLYDDVYALDLGAATPTWTRLTPSGVGPLPREGHVAVFDAARNRMVVFAGQGHYDLYADAWELGFASGEDGAWRELAPAGFAPAPRTEAAVAFDPATSRLFVGGGLGFHDVHLDRSVLDLSSADGTWSSQSPAPISGVAGAFVWDDVANQLFQYSGQAYYGVLGDLGAPRVFDSALVLVGSESAAFLLLGQGYHELSGRIFRLDL
jgi:hypothetical protein